jgi:hypothetical protein
MSINPVSHPEEFSHYLFILDGEVVWRHSVAKKEELEMVHAIFSSNPEIVKAPDEIAPIIENGWTYDGVLFNPPEN